MNTTEIKQLSEDALTKLMEALERGESETFKNYLKVMARFHSYSFQNGMLIMSQCPTASHVAGYQTWRKLGRQVMKGAKGIAILAPMVGKVKPEEQQDGEERRLFGFRAVYVFDVASTTGKELPEFATVKGDPQQYLERLLSFVASKGITLDYSDAIAPAKGQCCGKAITLLPNMELAESFATLVHEVAHSELHTGARRKETTKKVRETEAEAVAFVVSSAIGLDTNTASADYLQTYGSDRDTLAASLAFVQQTANEILEAILPDSPADQELAA
jgi:hypothetical protein